MFKNKGKNKLIEILHTGVKDYFCPKIRLENYFEILRQKPQKRSFKVGKYLNFRVQKNPDSDLKKKFDTNFEIGQKMRIAPVCIAH